MAVLNVTPDSFSDGGRFGSHLHAAETACAMLDAGAAIIDVGGESTRPGADRVPAAEQVRRVVPVIAEVLSRRPDAIVSIDTTLAEVAGAAIDAGAAIVNDVSAGSDDAALVPLVVARRVGIVIMHRVTTPDRDSYSDAYDTAPMAGDIVEQVLASLRAQMRAFVSSGGEPNAAVLDPGLGFGKTVEQNIDLIRRTTELLALGRPILSGLSRKSFVGRVSLERDSEPAERGPGTAAFTALHRAAGASIFRVHDVSATIQALRAADAIARTAL